MLWYPRLEPLGFDVDLYSAVLNCTLAHEYMHLKLRLYGIGGTPKKKLTGHSGYVIEISLLNGIKLGDIIALMEEMSERDNSAFYLTVKCKPGRNKKSLEVFYKESFVFDEAFIHCAKMFIDTYTEDLKDTMPKLFFGLESQSRETTICIENGYYLPAGVIKLRDALQSEKKTLSK